MNRSADEPRDLDQFVSVLLRSKLLGLAAIQPAVTEALAESRSVEKFEVVKRFCTRLVRDKLLTDWQCEKLLQGKHKGFQLGAYTIQQFSHEDEQYSYYNVIDASGKPLLVKVTPRSLDENGQPKFEWVSRETSE